MIAWMCIIGIIATNVTNPEFLIIGFTSLAYCVAILKTRRAIFTFFRFYFKGWIVNV